MAERMTGNITPKQTVTGELARALSTGGTDDYNKLKNQPSIETITLIGDHPLSDFGLQSITQEQLDEILNNLEAEGAKYGYLDLDGVKYVWDRITGTFARAEAIPTRVSELTNDLQFETERGVDSKIQSAITGLNIPERTSQLDNDSDFQTGEQVTGAISTAIEAANIPTKTSDLTNDSTFQTLAEVVGLINEAIGEAVGLKFEVVQALPETGEGGTIYLVPKASALTQNTYDEYVWYNSSWELIGSTDIDLSGYVNTEALNAALDTKVDKEAGKGLSSHDYTDEDKAIVDGVTDALAGKADSGDVPTSLSELSEDSTHRLVTDTEKSAWNGKAETSDIPTKTSDLTNDSDYVSDADYVHTDNNYDDTAKAAVEGLATVYVKLTDKATDADIYEIFGKSPVTIKPFATATDAEITAMLEAVRNGDISLSDLGWNVGDEHTVHLLAMEATGVGESHVEQDQTLVLLHGPDMYDLVDGGKNLFVVGLKNCLANGTTLEGGYINSIFTTIPDNWNGTARNAWVDSVFYSALPEVVRGWFKQFKYPANRSDGEGYFTLPSEAEVMGSFAKYVTDEGSQMDYFKTAANRAKYAGDSGTDVVAWWFRSNYYQESYNAYYCHTKTDGTVGTSTCDNKFGLAPYGCF